MKKSWKLIPKIIDGTKTVESRWYKTKRTPWDKIKKGDNLFFKNSGKPVSLVSKVIFVTQFIVKNNKQAIQIMKQYAQADLGTPTIPKQVLNYILGKKYAIFVFFSNVEQVKPFNINKKGYGFQSAWLVTKGIDSIKQRK